MQYIGKVFLLLMVLATLTFVLMFVFVVQVPPGEWVAAASERDIRCRLAGPLSADDPRVLKILRDDFLEPPSSLPYNFSTRIRDNVGRDDFTWPWIYGYLKDLFQDQRGGVFIEAGALDGVYLSNTLWLERNLGWTGLLVEADAASYRALSFKRRKAWISNTCLSSTPHPTETIMVSRRVIEKDLDDVMYWWAYRGNSHELREDFTAKPDVQAKTEESYSVVQCFPLLSYILALNLTTVDLLSLDIQGTEALVLESLLNSNFSARVIVAEDEQKSFDHTFMETQGYVLLASHLDHIYIRKGDRLLSREDVKDKIKVLNGKRGSV
ncbi:uncharacterized protein [Panulirus ornatus]|uniref:uncharacterized protein n=1 Tax=Panulirus ornatus TaxID=150431 RepID=UPI003A8A8DE5